MKRSGKMPLSEELRRLEAKALYVLAVRRAGPLEDVHQGVECPTCHGSKGISRITQEEMALINRTAVNTIYDLLTLKETDPSRYAKYLWHASLMTEGWDDPVPGEMDRMEAKIKQMLTDVEGKR